jgi:carnitine O-acetyltransferase
MAVHTFTQPSSLDATLATATDMSSSDANGSTRSQDSAKTSAQSFPSEAREPLAHSTNPNSKPGITFAHQDKLPKLPIPELESSCKKYIAALKPLQTPKEHNDTTIAIQEFLKSDGPVLQDKLKKYASPRDNYIEQFCKCLYTFHGPLSLAGPVSDNDPWMPPFNTSIRSEHVLTTIRVRLLSEL